MSAGRPPHDSSAQARAGAPPWWVLLVPMLASAWTRGWWAPDEPRYAEVAREAYQGASFLVLHLCDAVYPDKPPLVYWLAGACGLLGGWTEALMRLPTLLATAGSAWLVGRLALRLFGAREARWAPVLFLGFAMVVEIGGRLQLDPTLAFLCLAALVVAPARPAAGASPPELRAARRRALACGLLAGFAALAKGPVAWLHVALGLAALRLAFRGERGARAPLGLATWSGALLLALVPVGAWAAAASLLEPELAPQLFFRQHAGRLSEEAPHAGPLFKHVLNLPYLLLPWTALVLSGLRTAWSRARERSAAARGELFALVWFGAVLVVFSAIPPKRDLYLLPVYPALALLAARELLRLSELPRFARWIGWSVPALLVLAGAGGLLAPLALPAFAQRIPAQVDGLAWRVPVVGAVALGTGLAMLAAARAQAVLAWARRGAWGNALLWTAIALALYPAIDRVKSTEALARELAARPERPLTIPCFGIQPEGFRFYGALHGGLPTVRDGLAEALAREGDFLALVRESDLGKLDSVQRAALVELERRQVGSRTVLVMGRR